MPWDRRSEQMDREMRTCAIFILFVALVLSTATSASIKKQDLIAHAIENGVDLAKPVTVTCEWSRSVEGSNVREAVDLLRGANFIVSTSTIRPPEPAKTEYKLQANWSGILQEIQMRSVIDRMAAITAGQGSFKWQLSQTRP